MSIKDPKTLMEAIKYFSTDEVCHDFVEGMRWPNHEVKCQHCESERVGFIQSRRKYQCKACRKQFSIKTGTIFEDSPLGLDKWLCAIWIIANAKNGVSSYEISRSIGVTQKSAWHMLQRIRLAMKTGSFESKLEGEVEVDETYIGGKITNMHGKKKKEARSRGTYGKTGVIGMLERNGEVRAQVIPNSGQWSLMSRVSKNVEFGSTLYTDQHGGYLPARHRYTHEVINHAHEYVRGNVHTNGMENFWSLLKRGLKGTYINVEPFHLYRYLDEQIFRFNHRKLNDLQRFKLALNGITKKRLTYDKLITEAMEA